MLEDMIRAYETAMRMNDQRTIEMIEKRLYSLGMDRRSLMAIISERRK